MFWMERYDMDDNEYSSKKIKNTRMQFSMLLSFSNHCHCHLSISAENEILNESPDASSVCAPLACVVLHVQLKSKRAARNALTFSSELLI